MTLRIISTLLVSLVCSACDKPITSTFVDGEASGITIPEPRAFSNVDTDLIGRPRTTVWIGTNLQCAELRTLDPLVDPGPSAKLLPDGGRATLLILQQETTAYLDLGLGEARATGGVDFEVLERGDEGFKGRFEANFSRQRDGGGARGKFTGDFIATPCGTANAGCEATPVGTFAVLALALLRMRRR